MRSSHIFAGIIFPFSTLAAPYLPRGRLPGGRLPGILHPRQANASCDLTEVKQPANTLQVPGDDLSLVLIALGRGTQNYTCADEAATPASFGAMAQLFNASCAVASNEMGTLSEDPAAIGMHFFVDSTTPDFDIIGLGNTQLKKAESVAAPSPADVPWLRLEALNKETNPVRQIYRLETRGGLAPTSCSGQQAGAVVTIEYEAQYWIYVSAEGLNARRRKRSLGLPLI
ncbi:hypothetical protein K469DRAFT_721508 [Zopfia rhizophila CBS 207.26]|uniref:Malate dehydrogenase n=1 Tax=Zopfia rhizophila CBS 207.26 TaxID=1314779 RepID=A0A6A6EIB2_9PEZI|nr:hypothetical protein K469DRAFT_721508 [Zopfia rhizophila CBS 207.26]